MDSTVGKSVFGFDGRQGRIGGFGPLGLWVLLGEWFPGRRCACPGLSSSARSWRKAATGTVIPGPQSRAILIGSQRNFLVLPGFSFKKATVCGLARQRRPERRAIACEAKGLGRGMIAREILRCDQNDGVRLEWLIEL